MDHCVGKALLYIIPSTVALHRKEKRSHLVCTVTLRDELKPPAFGAASYVRQTGTLMASSLSPSGNSTTPVESASTTAQKRRSLQPAERSSVTDAYADLTGSRGREDGGEMNGLRGGYDNGSKHRTQYYEEQFQYKDNSTSAARDRVQRDSPIVAELKTNVIVG